MICRLLLIMLFLVTNLSLGWAAFNSLRTAGLSINPTAPEAIGPGLQSGGASAAGEAVTAIPFKERPPGKLPYNASEVAWIGDSRFLFCDNNISDALFEMRFTIFNKSN